MRSRGPDRVEAETDGRGAGRNTAALDQCGEPGRRIAAVRTGIELDADAGIEVDVGERTRERLLGGGEPVAVGADRAGEDEREPGRAVFEIVQGLGICRRGSGWSTRWTVDHGVPGARPVTGCASATRP